MAFTAAAKRDSHPVTMLKRWRRIHDDDKATAREYNSGQREENIRETDG